MRKLKMRHQIFFRLIDGSCFLLILFLYCYQFLKMTTRSTKRDPAKSRVKRKMENEEGNEIKKNHLFVQRLRPISEVTEEQNTICYNHNNEAEVQTKRLLQTEKTQQNISFCQKSYNCVKNIFQCFIREKFQIIVRQEEILKTMKSLRHRKLNIKPKIPLLEKDAVKSIVLDLEGTLVQISHKQFLEQTFSFQYTFRGKNIVIHGAARLGLESFLFEVSKNYEIIIYSSLSRNLVELILKEIDKKKRVRHILTVQHCLVVNKTFYLKTMEVLGREKQDVIFIDHNKLSGILHPENFLQIPKFLGEKQDRELIKYIPFLKQIASEKNILPIDQKFKEFYHKQIHIDLGEKLQTQENDDEQISNNFFESFAKNRKNHEDSMKKRKNLAHKRSGSQLVFLQSVQEEDQTETSSNLEAQQSAQDLNPKRLQFNQF